MASQTGFQSNTTIHAAFWIYKPDPIADPVGREVMVEVNSIQYLEATPAQIVVNNIASIAVTSNILTVIGPLNGVTAGMSVYFSGLTNATFLNKKIVTVASTSGTQFTANFTHVDYPVAAEPSGAQGTNAAIRSVWIYYPESNVSTSQAARKLEGVVATQFIYDMEGLFS